LAKSLAGIRRGVRQTSDYRQGWTTTFLCHSLGCTLRPKMNVVVVVDITVFIQTANRCIYDIEDWQNLWQEFAEEFDKQVITGKDGQVRSCPTNLVVRAMDSARF